ncbi:MAG: bifunctional riboflavin kinase/FAD synthetase [Arcanobacterium sp.]|nr:bifunctional riboflavin kinase/FAD synthetase [Arcanobacterium sp.]
MQIWRNPEEIPHEFGETVVTVGIFDGMHKGHRAVLGAAVKLARETGRKSVALTFDPHPQLVHHPDSNLKLVTSLSDRLSRLEAAGVDAVYVQHYNLEYAQASPAEFIEQQLVGQLKAKAVVVGEDVRFGKDNAGDGAYLISKGAELGVSVVLVSDLCDERGRRWSSTWIRDLLAQGDVAQAAQILGRYHRIRGVVQHGFKRGRELGFPTANLSGDELGEVPADGVYAGWLVTSVPGAAATVHLPAAISIGTNPQFAGEQRTVEAHVLGRSDLDLYGQEIALDFVEFLRPMLTFSSLDELLDQMDEDLRNCAQVLGVPVAHRLEPGAVTVGTVLSSD